jgi:hypothetical protein
MRSLILWFFVLVCGTVLGQSASSPVVIHEGTRFQLTSNRSAFLFGEEISFKYRMVDSQIGSILSVRAIKGELIKYDDTEIKVRLGNEDVTILAIAFGDPATKIVRHIETVYIPVVNETKATLFLNADGNALMEKGKIHPGTFSVQAEIAMSGTERCLGKVRIRRMKVFVINGTQVAEAEYFGPVFTLNDFSIIQPGATLTVQVLEADCLTPQQKIRSIYLLPAKSVVKAKITDEATRHVRFSLEQKP